MGNFPFFRFPYRNYYMPYYSQYNYRRFKDYPNFQNENNKTYHNDDIKDTRNIEHKKTSSKSNSFANINLSNLFSSNLNEPILEILGINLYLDDIIILGLLFFLYTEGVQDEILFITLILLLLS